MPSFTTDGPDIPIEVLQALEDCGGPQCQDSSLVSLRYALSRD
jgi:hypothetical protein